MDNKKRVRNLIIYLSIPIALIVIVAVFLGTRGGDSPKTSELVRYFQEHKVSSYTINYGSGAIEMTLKEGELPYPKTDDSSTSATSPTSAAKTGSKTKYVVKGQLADIHIDHKNTAAAEFK